MKFRARFCLSAFALLAISLIWSYFVVSTPFEGADSAYEAAYNLSTSIFSFVRFSLYQSYPSLPLWLFYLICNFFGFSFHQSVYLQAFFYTYISLILPFVFFRFTFSRNLFASIVAFYPFAVFGYFGIVLMASAFKMLFAFIFFMLFCISSFSGNKLLSRILIFLSLTSHFSIIILFSVCFYREIYRFISKYAFSIFSKIKLSFLPVLIAILAGLAFSFEVILYKISYNFFSGSNYESGFGGQFSILFSVFVMSLWLSGSFSLSFLPFYAFVLPVFLSISLGRISWLYLFGLYFVNFMPCSFRLTVFQRALFLFPISYYYFARSVYVLSSRDLMF